MKRKICISFLIALLIFSLAYGIVNAATSGADVKGTFVGSNTNADNMAYQIIGSVLTIIRVCGVTVAIVILMVIGAKYIVASAGDRADIKKYAVKYVIGALILFSASGIIGILQNFADKNLQN